MNQKNSVVRKLPFSFSFGRSSLSHHARTTILENYFYEIIKRFLSLFTRVVVIGVSFFKRDDVFERIRIKTLIKMRLFARARVSKQSLRR